MLKWARRRHNPDLSELLMPGTRPHWCRSWDDLTEKLQAPSGRVQTVNALHAYLFLTSTQFRDVTRAATVLTPDGWPLALAVRLSHRVPTELVTGSDLCLRLLDGSWGSSLQRVALVGGRELVMERFKRALEVAGRHVVHIDWSDVSDLDPDDLAKQCAVRRPDVVLIALPSEPGERFAQTISERLDAWVVCVGAGPEMAFGEVGRAPKFFQKMGLEWAWRLAREPRRLWRRYVLQCLPVVVWHLPRAVLATRRRSSDLFVD